MTDETRRTEMRRSEDESGTKRVPSLLEEGLDREYYTAAVVVTGGVDDRALEDAVGRPSPTDDRRVTAETPFDLASLTKPIVTTTCFFRLLERGRIARLLANAVYEERQLYRFRRRFHAIAATDG